MGAFVTDKTRTISFTPREYSFLEREETVTVRMGLTAREVAGLDERRDAEKDNGVSFFNLVMEKFIISWSFEDGVSGETAPITEEYIDRLALPIWQRLMEECSKSLPLPVSTSSKPRTARR